MTYTDSVPVIHSEIAMVGAIAAEARLADTVEVSLVEVRH